MTGAGLQFHCSRAAIVLGGFGMRRAVARSHGLQFLDEASAASIVCLCKWPHAAPTAARLEEAALGLCLLGTREFAAEPSEDSRVMPLTNCLEL